MICLSLMCRDMYDIWDEWSFQCYTDKVRFIFLTAAVIPASQLQAFNVLLNLQDHLTQALPNVQG